MGMKLPIEYIPGTDPPRFRWKQRITSPVGTQVIDYEGLLVPSAEQALKHLCVLADWQAREINKLKKQLDEAYERVATQSEILSKKAETPPAKKGK